MKVCSIFSQVGAPDWVLVNPRSLRGLHRNERSACVAVPLVLNMPMLTGKGAPGNTTER
jgi:hypothetical protein